MQWNQLDSVKFRLKGAHDWSWLRRHGAAFWAIDETGSGCLGLGMERDGKKYFCKIAGADTIEAEAPPEESIRQLKAAVPLYAALRRPNLVRLTESYDQGPFFVAVFEWAEGECLFDHWNFEQYQKNPNLQSPKARFQRLPVGKKLRAAEALFSFLQHTAEQGYVAVDFYDGSILYDFDTDQIMICDVDFFRPAPVINDKGADWFGTKRLKAPEEYQKGAVIDQQTNLFTLGALLFEFFGRFSPEEVQKRYQTNTFLPCAPNRWQLDEGSYQVAAKAVRLDREERYRTFAEFFRDWQAAVGPFYNAMR